MKRITLLLIALSSLFLQVCNAQFNVLFNFNEINGGGPESSLTLFGNKLYGVTTFGGANNEGNIFSMDTNGSGYNDLFDFGGINGIYPYGSLIFSNGILYGMTYTGGSHNRGLIFSIDSNGTNYRDLLDFNGINGKFPSCSLTLSGKILYGMTDSGGVHNQGCIFSIDTNGNGYRDLLDFNGTNGSLPTFSKLLLSGSVLYGMTLLGGIYGEGNIFSIDTSGSNYNDLLDFNGYYGARPRGLLVLSKNTLFGMTQYGGAYDSGCIYSIDTNGNEYRDVLDFNGPNGKSAYSSLTLVGSSLFGMTDSGGGNDEGLIFSLDTDGTNYHDLVDFNGSNGKWPCSNLISSGRELYGMTFAGGADYYGVVFNFLPPCTNNYNQPICIVTTDTAINKNVIIWGRNNSPPDGSFNIYDSTLSGWVKIGSVSDTALSEYIDTASNPNLKSYSYRISTVDSCGESVLSPPHSTIYLQVAQLMGRDSLYWTSYVGFATPQYLIYRGLSLNALTLIDSVPGSTLDYIDNSPLVGYLYMVEAINPSGGCIPTHRRISRTQENNAALSLSNGGIPRKLTGIKEILPPGNSVRVIPNPNNGIFTLQVKNEKQKNNSIEVYNILGEKVYSSKLNSSTTQLDLSNNPSGVYLYRVLTETGDLLSEGKFVIQK